MQKNTRGLIGIAAITLLSFLQQDVFSQKVTIPIETQHNALVLQTNATNNLGIIYLGPKLSDKIEYEAIPAAYKQTTDYTGVANAAYATSGSRNLFEPAITVTHADGNNSLDLQYVSYETKKLDDNTSLLTIVLKDPVYELEVKLFYKTWYNEDVTEQWTEIKNNEKGNVVLQKYASAGLYLKADNFYLRQYHGDWAKEMQPEESRITHGIKTLDSKLGTRADLFQPPVFMVSLNKPATEDEGSVLYGALEWSGNFKIDLELDNQDNLRIIAGVNNHASPYTLKPGEVLTTPAFLSVLSHKGKGEASRQLQAWARNYKLLDGKGTRLTLLNNWESTYFDFNETKLKALLKDTKELGVDLFLLDDGWFANKYPRNDDHAGLGDWQENKSKLPNGIATLVSEGQHNGVRFGIWVEPEMVNPKSELYEKHPDWVVRQPKRPEYYFRNQLVLDLTNPQVQDFVFNVIDNLFTKNPNLAYIKWDCNAVVYNAYSAHLTNQSHFYLQYVQGLYSVLQRIRKKYPTVPMMLCSGGGGRVDYGALQYFTEFWPSDNTDPLERIFMQWEYSYFYPAISSSNHVTDWGKQPLKYRTDVAMMGKLGFDIVVSKLNASDLEFCRYAIKNYDAFKYVILQGDQYRLQDPRDNAVAAMMYLNPDKRSGIVFNYLVNNRYDEGSARPIKMKGLDPRQRYRLTELNLYPGTTSTIADKSYTGEFLMTVGYNPDVKASRTSVVLLVKAE
ncbi:alpha-galactosidase [Niastella koreensis]|uniref:Alpha-galactosidase n=2 Tax=Niastella koreensis TaxID=354356 RepID=G8TQU7_NIAKG|nr:alpha-galactosidase [Niastella koreensis]AEV97846.1 Alpha-galactosidase [Niastella koreensis GR20-10]OQP40346.1 alpha-galactosidase [Niastella koreensis]